jgi:hypothetical protein
MTIPQGRHGRPDTVVDPQVHATNLRTIGATITGAAYLLLLLLTRAFAEPGGRFTAQLLTTAIAGGVASVAVLAANLLIRHHPRPDPVPRWLTAISLIVATFGTVVLLGLGLFYIAIGDMRAALLALGCIVPTLAVTIPAIPTLLSLSRA